MDIFYFPCSESESSKEGMSQWAKMILKRKLPLERDDL